MNKEEYVNVVNTLEEELQASKEELNRLSKRVNRFGGEEFSDLEFHHYLGVSSMNVSVAYEYFNNLDQTFKTMRGLYDFVGKGNAEQQLCYVNGGVEALKGFLKELSRDVSILEDVVEELEDKEKWGYDEDLDDY